MLDYVVHTHRPNLALLHLVEVDHVKHVTGPQSPEAYAAVKFADERVREVWEELKKDYPGKATLIGASDHGFDPNQDGLHGTFVAWGAGIQPGAKLGTITITNTDVAPTIAELLGLKMPGTD